MRTALFLVVATLVGCVGPRRSDDPQVRDEEICRDVAWELHGDDRFSEIRVTCKKGVVFLDGVVTDESDREQARRKAWGVSGVEEVKSSLRLRSR